MPLSPTPYAAKQFAEVDGRRMAYIDEGTGAGDRLPARQPHLVLPVAQHHAPLRGPRPPRRLRPDRHGRFRQARPLRPRPLRLRRAARAICSRCGTSSTSAPRSSSCCTTGARRWASSGRAATPSRVAGLVYMEALVTPVTWADWPENARRAFQGFRSPAGEDMILEKNMFVERILPGSILRKLSDEEMAEYRRPFADPRRGPPPHPELAPPDPDRRRARRRRGRRRRLLRLARH